MLAKLFPAADRKHANRPTQYRRYQNVLKAVQAPMPIDAIAAFEEANFIAVDVYTLDENECVVPLQPSCLKDGAREHVHLLYVENEEDSHYILITDLSKLLHHCSAATSSYAELPSKLNAKNATVNPECVDRCSFRWGVLIHKYGSGLANPERPCNYYRYDDEFTNYRRSMELSDIKNFEKRELISVNIYVLDGEKVRPRQITQLNPENVTDHIDMLLLEGGHYVLIKDLSRLCRKQVTSKKNRHYICRRCLHFCTSESVLEKHVERCSQHRAQAIKMPKPTWKNPENTVHFKAIEKQLPLPFWFVADFESIIEPTDADLPEVPESDFPVLDPKTGQKRFAEHISGEKQKSSTVKTGKHIACGVAYQLCSVDPRFYEPPVILHGSDCGSQFLDRIIEDAKRVRGWLAAPEPQPVLTAEEQR